MKNFRDKKLYDDDIGNFRNFLGGRLVTKSEYDVGARLEGTSEDEEEELDLDGFDSFSELTGMSQMDFSSTGYGDFDTGGNDFFGGGGNDFFGGGMVDDGFGSISDISEWNNHRGLAKMPLGLKLTIQKSFQHIKLAFPTVDEWDNIMSTWQIFNIVVVLFTGLSWLLGFNYLIISVKYQFIINLVSLIGTEIFLFIKYRKGILATFLKLEPKEISLSEHEKEGENSDDSIDFNSFGESESESDSFSFSFGEDDEDLGMDIFDLSDDSDEDLDMEDYDEDEDEEDFNSNRVRLPESNLDISEDYFEDSLLEIFDKNKKYNNKLFSNRLKLLTSFSDYLVQNKNIDFSKYTNIREKGVEYNNIAYSIFKAINLVFPKFQTDKTKSGKFTVMSMKKSPLLYIIQLQLPNYININSLISKRINIENSFKAHEDDSDVSILIESFDGKLVFKLLRLDVKENIGLGDVLRLETVKIGRDNNTVLEEYIKESNGMPIFLGLRGNEFPTVIDLEENTNSIIVGGSGSGKSWTTFSLMWNFVLANSPDEVQFLILDKKNANFWVQFAKMPHVIGLHSDPMDFIPLLQEVELERQRRQKLLHTLAQEDVKGARKYLKRRIAQGDKEAEEMLKQIPLLTVVIDEITATMSTLEQFEKGEMYKELKLLLTEITSQCRSAGIRIIQIGQRAIDTSIAKGTLANSSLKFGMKMEVENDFTTLFGKDSEKVAKPNSMGLGILSASEDAIKNFPMVKTVTLGVSNDSQMTQLIRTVALDWVRRVGNNIDLTQAPPGTSYSDKLFNRPKIYAESIKDLREGNILGTRITPEYAVNLANFSVNSTDVIETVETENGFESKMSIEEYEEILDNNFSEPFEEEESESISSIDFTIPTLEEIEPEEDIFTSPTENNTSYIDIDEDIYEEENEEENEEISSTEDTPIKNISLDSLLQAYENNSENNNKPNTKKVTEDNSYNLMEREFKLKQKEMELELEKINNQREIERKEIEMREQLLKEQEERFANLENNLMAKLLKQTEINSSIPNTTNKKINSTNQEVKNTEIKKEVPKEPKIPKKEAIKSTVSKEKEKSSINKKKNSKKTDSKVLSIPQFVQTHGEQIGQGSYKISQEELTSLYSKVLIEKAIRFNTLVEDGTDFILDM